MSRRYKRVIRDLEKLHEANTRDCLVFAGIEDAEGETAKVVIRGTPADLCVLYLALSERLREDERIAGILDSVGHGVGGRARLLRAVADAGAGGDYRYLFVGVAPNGDGQVEAEGEPPVLLALFNQLTNHLLAKFSPTPREKLN